MPAAPPRTRPAGAARSSPSAPRPGTRGGRSATRAPDPRRRLRVGQIVLVVALVVATVKLVVVQGPQAGTLQAGSARQRTSEIALPAERGRVLDRVGAPLAFSVEARALVTNPRLIATTKGAGTAAYVTEMAATVAQATGADATALRTALESDKGYVVLVPLVDPDVARTLRDKYPEIAEEKRESRQYPGGALAANVVGVASWNATDRKLTGLMGLESSQDNLLAGQDGLRVVDTAEGSSAVIPGSTRFERPATPGSDLQLTLDSDLQYTMQRQLAEYAAAKGAKGGSAVVLDAKTGEVLAMANARTFDPRAFSSADEATLGNPAVSSPYEPGSVNKVVTMAAALEYRTAAPDRVFSVPGSIRVADRTVSDAWNHGTEPYTLTGILAKSSNVGTIMAAREVGEDRFADMLARFGLGKRTGVGLPGESPGRVPARETWSGSTFGNLPIGQGLSVTALQMAGMYQAVANDGVRIPPRIVEATVGPDGVRTPVASARGGAGHLAGVRAHAADDAHRGDAGRPHRRHPGHRLHRGDPGLPGGGEDRHRAAGRPVVRLLRLVDVLDHVRGHAPGPGPAVRRRDHARRPAGRDERRAAVPRHRLVPGAAREAAGEPGPAADPDPGVPCTPGGARRAGAGARQRGPGARRRRGPRRRLAPDLRPGRRRPEPGSTPLTRSLNSAFVHLRGPGTDAGLGYRSARLAGRGAAVGRDHGRR